MSSWPNWKPVYDGQKVTLSVCAPPAATEKLAGVKVKSLLVRNERVMPLTLTWPVPTFFTRASLVERVRLGVDRGRRPGRRRRRGGLAQLVVVAACGEEHADG